MKRYAQARALVEASKLYDLQQAIALVKKMPSAKFDETVDLAFRLGVDPRHADQMIRGALGLPAGTGKDVRICVITSGENIERAKEAGAEFVGGDEIIQKIAAGWTDFDRVVASPEMMGKLGRIGRVLGPRGLMPSPKVGTVTPNVAQAVAEQKAGKVEYRTDKQGIVHVPVGKKSFDEQKLYQNVEAVVMAIVKAKPAAAKGIYLRSLTMSTTMGPGVRIDPMDALKVAS